MNTVKKNNTNIINHSIYVLYNFLCSHKCTIAQ